MAFPAVKVLAKAQRMAFLGVFARTLRFCVKLITRTEQTAENALHADLTCRNCEWLQLGVCRLQLDIHTTAIEPLERRLVLFNQQRHDDLAVTRISTILDQRDITVADVLVDHRVAFHTQRINAIGLHPSEQEARHGDAFFVIDYFKRRTGSNSSEQLNLTQRVAALVFHLDVQRKRSVFVFTDQQTATLQRCDMLCNSRTRLNTKLSCDLRVRWDVTVPFLEPSDVIENLFLSLRSWEH